MRELARNSSQNTDVKELRVKIFETKELWPQFRVPLLGGMCCVCWDHDEGNLFGAQGQMSQGWVWKNNEEYVAIAQSSEKSPRTVNFKIHRGESPVHHGPPLKSARVGQPQL
jgi:hypothetical protein